MPIWHSSFQAPARWLPRQPLPCWPETGIQPATAAWLNIGIAGHAHHAIGSAFIAHRITDSATGTNWYPPQIHDLPIPTENLCTVDCPEDSYPAAALYEMEASGFFPVACRFSSGELVQCFKVISDNRTQANTAVTAKLCTQLITAKLTDIEQLVNALSAMADDYARWHAPHPGLKQLSTRRRFTVSQQHRLPACPPLEGAYCRSAAMA